MPRTRRGNCNHIFFEDGTRQSFSSDKATREFIKNNKKAIKNIFSDGDVTKKFI